MESTTNLIIVVQNPPLAFLEEGIRELKLVCQGKKSLLDPEILDQAWKYVVPVEIKADGRPGGPFVYRYGDQRSFVYLQWWGRNAANQWVTFRRIKLYFDQIEGWPQMNTIAISGTDRKGHPACSTAIALAKG